MANEFLFGLAMGNARQANNANEAAYSAAIAANAAGKGLLEAADIIGKLKDENATLRLEAQRYQASIDAMDAQIGALQNMYPSSSLFQKSDKRYKAGHFKSNIRLIYEHHFDAEVRKIGIANPASVRTD